MLVTLIRHGQIPANVDKRFAGITDEKLTPIGIEQAESFHAPKVDKIFVSPLTRCRETADLIFPDQEKTIVPELREMDFGIFENKRHEDMLDFEPYLEWAKRDFQGQIPGGDHFDEYSKRCCAAFEKILSENKNCEHLAFVIHGGPIMKIMDAYDEEHHEYYKYHIGNCDYFTCKVLWNPELSLKRIAGAKPTGSFPPKDFSQLGLGEVK